jgi:hypothetical protein
MTYDPGLPLAKLLGARILYAPPLAASAFSAAAALASSGSRVAFGALSLKFLASFRSTEEL